MVENAGRERHWFQSIVFDFYPPPIINAFNFFRQIENLILSLTLHICREYKTSEYDFFKFLSYCWYLLIKQFHTKDFHAVCFVKVSQFLQIKDKCSNRWPTSTPITVTSTQKFACTYCFTS